MKIAIVGATGLVGEEMMKVLESSGLPVEEFLPVASERSMGKKVTFLGKEYPVMSAKMAMDKKPHAAVFSAGAEASRILAPQFASAGTTVIDNSSAWRRDPGIPLIVPEINAHTLKKHHKIIANPNCSTIQMVMVMAPLHRHYRILRAVVATYQSVTGSGAKGMLQLERERQGDFSIQYYPHRIDLNLIPHGGNFQDDGYTSEEEKLQFETCKILNDETIKVTATVVRVPVYGGHSEAVNLEFGGEVSPGEARKLLSESPGIVVEDDPQNNIYPMPWNARGRNEVFVGRIRKDFTVEHGLNMWIVSDNLRKGAATNAIQILKYLWEQRLIPR
jgi:aspartate-semialdehyde dehydrogenase